MKKLLKERYEVLEKLGIGGMGVVYKGKDTLLDRLVAIKMIPPHIQDEDIVRRFITEAHALARLNHPYIVRYYEMGEEDGQYYLIMEYVDGKNIKEAVSSLSDPLQQMTKFTRQVCEALDYAHLQGIIHRDVKPGNLLVDFTENIKVMDFGLARILLEGTRITASGSILGTAAYMAPEQTLSSNVDFRADLYSLGVTLFELSTGRLPFEGNDPVAIIMQHCSEPPPLPRSLNSRIPVSLEKIILKLLAKSPAERFPSAIALKEALERIDWKETSACEPAIFSSSYCRMAGREKELNYLRNLLDQTLQRKSKFVFIDGELGIGKSRILHRLYSYAALQGFKTAVGICTYPSELYQPFLQIFESMGLQTSLFAPMEDEQERTFSSIVEHLKPVMSREPLAFFLEDINQADEGSLQFLKYLTKNLEGLPFFLFGTLDTRETVPVFQKFWLDMNDCAETEVMTLEGLSSFETEEIVKAFLNVNSLPEELNIQIFQNSGGNPLYIREILNSLIEDKILAKDGERLIFTPLMELKVPHSLKDIIEKRIKSLDSEVLNLLSTASVLGSRFDFEILLEILQMQEDKLLDLLKKCVEEQILKEEWGKGKDEYVFSNHLFREVFYRNMSPRRRKNFHQKAGEILEKICAGNSSEYCNALAYHFFLSENLEKAIYYGTLAGEKAMKYFSYQEAGDYWNKVLTLMEGKNLKESPEKPLEILISQAQAHNFLGKSESSWNSLKKAESISSAIVNYPRLPEIKRRLGQLCYRQGKFDEALGYYEEGLKFVLNSTAPEAIAEKGKIYNALAALYRRQGKRDKALDSIEKALESANFQGDRAQIADILTLKGLVYKEKGEGQTALECYQKSLQICEEIGDYTEAVANYNNLGGLWLELMGDHKKALECFDKGLQLAKKINNKTWIGALYSNAACAYYYRGEWAKAVENLEKGFEIQKKGNAFQQMSFTLNNLAEAYREMGDFDKAMGNYHQALSIALEAQDAEAEVQSYLGMGVTLLLKGDREKSLEYLVKTRDMSEASGYKPALTLAYYYIAKWHFEEGDDENTGVFLDKSERLFEEVRNPEVLVKIKELRGERAFHKREWEKALLFYGEGLKLLENLPRVFDKGRILYEIGRLYLNKYRSTSDEDSRQKGLKFLDDSLNIFNQIGAETYINKVKKEFQEILKA